MVNFVYFARATNWSYKFWCAYNHYSTANTANKRYYTEWFECAGNRKFNGDIFYKEYVKPDQHYFYIITPEFMEAFEDEMKRINMWEYKIYESSEFAENYNYPSEARLKVFIFHTPKDFVHQPTGEMNV